MLSDRLRAVAIHLLFSAILAVLVLLLVFAVRRDLQRRIGSHQAHGLRQAALQKIRCLMGQVLGARAQFKANTPALIAQVDRNGWAPVDALISPANALLVAAALESITKVSKLPHTKPLSVKIGAWVRSSRRRRNASVASRNSAATAASRCRSQALLGALVSPSACLL